MLIEIAFRNAEIAVGLRIVRLESNREIITLDRRVKLFNFSQGIPAIAVGLCIIWLERNCTLITLNRYVILIEFY